MPKMSNESKSKYFKAGEVIGLAVSAVFWVSAVTILGAICRVVYEVGRMGWTGFYYF